jgi:cysteine/O-acetylserine efflux protein
LNLETLSLISFVLVTIYTPGPNNISSASMGILYGYKKTLKYLIGIAAGFFIVLQLTGWVSSFLLEKFPAFEGVLRIIGALYILWLAWGTLRASYAFDEADHPPFGFPKGFFLQILNPKGVIFGLTIYSTFLANQINTFFSLLLSAAIFAIVAFSSTSLWTLFGAGIRKYLNKPRIKQVINIILALLLIYSAVEMSGILDNLQ